MRQILKVGHLTLGRREMKRLIVQREDLGWCTMMDHLM